MKRMPKTVYVVWDEEQEVFYADVNLFDIIDAGGDKTRFGTYKLEKEGNAKKVVSVE